MSANISNFLSVLSEEMASPEATREAIQAVKAIVANALSEPTNAIMERLERLEEQMARPSANEKEVSAAAVPPGRTGMCSALGAGDMSSPSATLPTHLPTPSGNGAIPPGLQVPGLSSYGSAGGPSGVGFPMAPGLGGVGVAGGMGSGGATGAAPGLASLGGAMSIGAWGAAVSPGALGEIPLSTLLLPAGAPSFMGGVIVGQDSPPIPAKLADKIWRGEYVDLNLLLPHRLGAPEPTLSEAFQRKAREEKQISTIEQWVICFSSYMSVVVLRAPNRTRDLLAYLSLVVKAAHNFEGTPWLWLSYDAHFRCLAATMQLQCWSTPNQGIWSQYFSRASPRNQGTNALSVGPYLDTSRDDKDERKGPKPAPQTSSGGGRKRDRPSPYPKQAPICMRWNREGCRAPDCTFRHICLECHGAHRETNCPTSIKGGTPGKGKHPFRAAAGPSGGGQ